MVEIEAVAESLPQLQLSEQERQELYNAVQSLNPEYEGFNLDDFMRSIQTLAAFNAQGRSFDDVFQGDLEVQHNKGKGNDNRGRTVDQMIQEGFKHAKDHIDEIRNEIEVQRLELIQERDLMSAKRSEMDFEKK